MNMSYCRFYNTLQDLRDCDEHIWDNDLSEEEEQSRVRLIKLCKKIAADFEEEDETE